MLEMIFARLYCARKSVSSLLLELVISAEMALARIKVRENSESFRYNDFESSSLYCLKQTPRIKLILFIIVHFASVTADKI